MFDIRRNDPYTTGVISLTLSCVKLPQQTYQREQVVNSEVGSSGREDDKGVDSIDIGPVRRNRMDALVLRLPEEHTVLAPGVCIADQLEPQGAQRVEGMGDSEPSRTIGTICI